MKLCKDCKYYSSLHWNCLKYPAKNSYISFIDGKLEGELASAFEERRTRCGIEARGFEPNLWKRFRDWLKS